MKSCLDAGFHLYDVGVSILCDPLVVGIEVSVLMIREDNLAHPEARGIVDNGDNCVTPGPLEGRYANYFKIGYNAFEFVIDFGQLYPAGEPGDKKAQFHTRIITAPVYAKALVETLQESIEQYAQSFGEIRKDEE